ncbi:hypothetical protein BBB56_03675 [Candidatus Pantoea deserta]|uniref:Uncharacterized protein n=1 Tax=Candidatus Pantoea deserta TaxID=1869313 RepID=A0A3N4PIM8_9GAMM|nr:hypothetical protein [Pantoea deserta]RPE03600.1 hypothetical protein BBB56_03675 [Pantoea deserta]
MSFQLATNICPDNPDLPELIAFIQRNIPKIAQPLAGDLQWYSPHAQLLPESFKIKSVEKLASNRFKMLYQFDGHIFSPCLDLNETFTREEQVSFRLLPGVLEFELIDNQPPSPADEL